MGAFHDGHLALMREARANCDTLIVSLFVNPTQFGPTEDFSRYPRDENKDAGMAESMGVDVLFAPTVAEIYPRKSTLVSVTEIPDRWEGAARPGHFDGVAMVVLKLFNIAMPDFAVFGLKDLQQCAVIRRMVEDLNVPVSLTFSPTVREPDGLALSSRNVYLSPENRAKAPAIYTELRRCAALFADGDCEADRVAIELKSSSETLNHLGFKVDYFSLVDTLDMSPLEVPGKGSSIIAAAKIGTTRLIDNIQIS